jgi:hypothetical protein
MAGRINKKIIEEQIFASKSVKKLMRDIVEKEVQKEKILFQNEFESHPVTQELDGGETSSNNSGTLGGYGNLFSFLGFNAGSKPTAPVKLLIRSIALSPSLPRKSGSKFRFTMNVPSKDDFASISSLPWESGRSWLLDIERGVSGLGAYLYGRFSTSRSGGGIQSKFKYSDRVFKPVKYFSQMYTKFLKRVGVK